MILGIYGCGGLGKGILQLARQINRHNLRWKRCIFIDDNKPEGRFKDIELWSFQRAVDAFGPEELEFSIAVGEPRIRKILFDKIQGHGFKLATLIHPGVEVPECAQVHKGAAIYPGAFIGCDVTICDNTVLLSNVNVGHDTVIGRHSIIAGFANIAGGCSIGEESFIGQSAAIIEGTSVGSETIVGMGSMVFRDIPDKVIVMGNPARPIQQNQENKVFNRNPASMARRTEGYEVEDIETETVTSKGTLHELTNLDRYILAFVDALGVHPSQLEGLEYKKIREWDSVGHMGLITALEQAFNIVLNPDDIIDLSSFTRGKEILAKYDVEI